MTETKHFWGLQVESGNNYAQTLSKRIAIRQAVLELVDQPSPERDKPKGSPDDVFTVVAKYDKTNFALCLLSAKKVETSQAKLHVEFQEGVQLGLSVQGNSNAIVHLTGYSFPCPSAPHTPGGSAICIPFEGQSRSILVSARKSSGDEEGKPKKRVSIDLPTSQARNSNEEGKLKKRKKAETEKEDADDEDVSVVRNGAEDNNEVDSDDADVDADGDEGEDDDEDDDDVVEIDEEDDEGADFDSGDDSEGSEEMDEATTEDETADEEGSEDAVTNYQKKIAALSRQVKNGVVKEEDEDDSDDEEISAPQVTSGKNFQSTPKLGKSATNKASVSLENIKPATPGSSKSTPVKNKGGEPKTPENKNKGKEATNELRTPENKNQLPPQTPSSAGHTPLKFTAKGGLVVQELKVGTGPIAKPGKMVTVYYQGRLKQNNKLFDKEDSGTGFKFRLGKGEVIKGWDLGVEGMKVGGKRRIVIPPNMGYGKKGAPPDIPPNSTLTFDIELKHV